MASLRCFGAVLVLIVSAVGTVCCAGGAIGVWVYYQSASERAQNIVARLDVALRRASTANQNIRRAVAKARADVAKTGKESADLSEGGDKGRRAAKSLKKPVQKDVSPGIKDLRGRLTTLSDAAVVVSSLLQSLQELPAGRINRIGPDQLGQWQEQAQQLTTNLGRLESLVLADGKETSGRPVAEAASQVDQVLQRCQTTVDAWQSDLDAACEAVREVQPKIGGWITLAAVGVTILCVWMAAGQISLFVHALGWLKGRPRNARDSQGSVPTT
jgi:hypothetical protein